MEQLATGLGQAFSWALKNSLQACRVSHKSGKERAVKSGLSSEDRTMEEDKGFGEWFRGLTEEVEVTVRA